MKRKKEGKDKMKAKLKFYEGKRQEVKEFIQSCGFEYKETKNQEEAIVKNIKKIQVDGLTVTLTSNANLKLVLFTDTTLEEIEIGA